MPSAYYPPPSSDPSKQPLDSTLTALAGLPGGADRLPYFDGVDTLSQTTFTSFARSLLDDSAASNARSTLGLGTLATQNSGGVSITGGTVQTTNLNNCTFGAATASSPSFSMFGTATVPTSPTNGQFWYQGGILYYRNNVNQTVRVNTSLV